MTEYFYFIIMIYINSYHMLFGIVNIFLSVLCVFDLCESDIKSRYLCAIEIVIPVLISSEGESTLLTPNLHTKRPFKTGLPDG